MRNESNVSSYSKVFPATFEYAKGDILTDKNGKEYIDFFSGAGALNYGHNNPKIKEALLTFLEKDAIIHCLDMDSRMKDAFLERFDSVILKPRKMNYKVQFSGPTGTNAVEAAVKLARKITQRRKVVSFTSSFHGMTATSLALSGNLEDRQKYYPSQEVVFFPFDGFLGEGTDTIEFMRKMILTEGSGLELPAAVILETVQAEGGVNIAGVKWLKDLRKFTEENNIILIVDDIQVGCGRTGNFFSFERAGIMPDIILLSKSISGFGLPLSLVLIKPEFDQWKPGEHNGTFRANNLSLCTANAALDFWKEDSFQNGIAERAQMISAALERLKKESEHIVAIRGIGMIWGLEFSSGELAGKVARALFDEGMMIETCGNKDQTIKLLSALNISVENLKLGLEKLSAAVMSVNIAEVKVPA